MAQFTHIGIRMCKCASRVKLFLFSYISRKDEAIRAQHDLRTKHAFHRSSLIDNSTGSKETSRFRQHNWGGISLSPLARQLSMLQSSCSSIGFVELPNYGFGSDLQIWSSRLCDAFSKNISLLAVSSGALLCDRRCVNLSFSLARDSCKSDCEVTAASSFAPPWIWDDQRLCPATSAPLPAMSCAFGQRVNPCLTKLSTFVHGPLVADAKSTSGGRLTGLHSHVSAEQCFSAAVEFLFAQMSPAVLHRARKAIRATFGVGGAPIDLISVHIRWGDKYKQSALQPIKAYLQAAKRLAQRYHVTNVSVFVTTEDRAALDAFQHAANAAGLGWRIYFYLPAILQDSRSHASPITRNHLTESPSSFARIGRGAAATESLVALMLALEARLLVVSEFSQWGKLILQILDSRGHEYKTAADCPYGMPPQNAGCLRTPDVVTFKATHIQASEDASEELCGAVRCGQSLSVFKRRAG
eukprot:6214675-Pleurochrysis_carterae.AAC.2